MANTSKLSKEERKRLQAILDQSYGSAFVNGSLAGGLGLGSLAAVYPATYSLTDLNLARSDQQRKDVQAYNTGNVIGFGTSGFLLGTPIGGFLNTARLMLQKRKARKLLGKTAAWQDYALGVGAGSIMGTGTGMAMNWALGRKLLDKRLLLSMALAGGGIGSLVGNIKDKQRASYNASYKTIRDCVKRDENKNIIKMRRRNETDPEGTPEYVRDDENGLPLYEDGIYYVKAHSAGGDDSRKLYGNLQPVRDMMGHDVRIIVYSGDEPLKTAYNYGGKTRVVSMQRGDNGQWFLITDLGVNRSKIDPDKAREENGKRYNGAGDLVKVVTGEDGKERVLIQNRHGEWVDDVNYTKINGTPVTPYNMRAENPFGLHQEGRDEINAFLLAGKQNGDFSHVLAFRLADDPQYNTKENLQRAMDATVLNSLRYNGVLNSWSPLGNKLSMLSNIIGIKTPKKDDCMLFAHWDANGQRRLGILPQRFSPKHFGGNTSLLLSPEWSDTVGEQAYGRYKSIEELRNMDFSEPEEFLDNSMFNKPYTYNIMNLLGYNTSNNNGQY